MHIVNGKWSKRNDELSSIDEHELSKMILKIKHFAEGQTLSHDKIRILSNILETTESQDELMVTILDADKEDLKIIHKLKVTI